MTQKFVFPADFVKGVENVTGEQFNEQQARAVLQLLGIIAGGRALLARILLPHFMGYIEREEAELKHDIFNAPRPREVAE